MKTLIRLLLALTLSVPALAAGSINLPKPEEIRLDNGLTVYFSQNSDQPLVSFQILIRGTGSAHEPDKLEGVADLTAQLLTRGAGSLSPETLTEELDFMGASLRAGSGPEFTQLSGNCLSEYFPRTLELAALTIQSPTFSSEEFRKERDIRVDNLASIKDNPARALQMYFTRAYYGKHPFGHLRTGTGESLKAMTVEDVRAFHKARFRPDQAILSVVGDITREKLVELLKTSFGKWARPSTPAPDTKIPDLPVVKGKTLILIDKPDATQSYFILAAPGISVADALGPQSDVLNTLLGGRFTSLLNTELRIKRGLTYGARSSFNRFGIGGIFTASSYTKNATIGEMLDITFDCLNKVRTEGFTEKDVESSRNYIQGQFPPTIETSGARAGAYAEMAFYNLGFDRYAKDLDAVKATTVADIKAAAPRLLPSTDYVLVIVGKADEIQKQLEKYGEFRVRKITEPGF